MPLELSAFVETDLDEIAACIADDNPGRAVTFIQDIRAKFRVIQRTPLLYQLRPDIGEEARMTHRGALGDSFPRHGNRRAHRTRGLWRARSSERVSCVVGKRRSIASAIGSCARKRNAQNLRARGPASLLASCRAHLGWVASPDWLDTAALHAQLLEHPALHNVRGGTAPAQVLAQIARHRARLS